MPTAKTKRAREPTGETPEDVARHPADLGTASVGQRLRAERERQRIGLRELARRVGVSASLVSQIELGRATPSVGTLYSIVSELNISLDELFFEASDAPDQTGARRQGRLSVAEALGGTQTSRPAPAPSEVPTAAHPVHGLGGVEVGEPVVRESERQAIHLGSGVTWERMNPRSERGVDFLYVIYDIGGASAPEQSLMRHGGREYGHLLEGRLNVTVGFDTYELQPGDAISFDSTMPHRLFNPGDTPAKAIWFVVGRQDPRVTPDGELATPDQ